MSPPPRRRAAPPRIALLAAVALGTATAVSVAAVGAEVRVEVVNDSGHAATVVMAETPTAAVLSPWPRVLNPGESGEAVFSVPDMTGAVGLVQYALPAESDGDSRTCLFRWSTDARRVVACEGAAVAQPVGVGAIECGAEVVAIDRASCAMTARFRLGQGRAPRRRPARRGAPARKGGGKGAAWNARTTQVLSWRYPSEGQWSV